MDWGERKRIKSANHGNMFLSRSVPSMERGKSQSTKNTSLMPKNSTSKDCYLRKLNFYFVMNQNDSSSLSSKT
jgi:hypothetical protein